MSRRQYKTGATRQIWLLLASAERLRCTKEIRQLVAADHNLAGTLRSMEKLGRACCEKRGRFSYFYVTEKCEIPTGISVEQVQAAFAKRAATGVQS